MWLPTLVAQSNANINYILPEVQDEILNKEKALTVNLTTPSPRYVHRSNGTSRWNLEKWYLGIAMALLSAVVLFCLCNCKYHYRWMKKQKQEQQKQQVFMYLQQFDVHDVDLRKSPPGGWHGTYLNRLAYGINTDDRYNNARQIRGSDGTVKSRLPYGSEDGEHSVLQTTQSQRRQERLALSNSLGSSSSSSDEEDFGETSTIRFGSNTSPLPTRHPTPSLHLVDTTGEEPKLGDSSLTNHFSLDDDDIDVHEPVPYASTNSSDELNSSTEEDYIAAAAKEVV